MQHYPAWQLAAIAICFLMWLAIFFYAARGVVNPDLVIRRQALTRSHPRSRTKVRLVGIIYVAAIPPFVFWYASKLLSSK
jgi:hypothetical protein